MFRPRSLCQMKPTLPDSKPMDDQYLSSLPKGYLQKVPKHTKCLKEFPTKTKKPMQFHQKGYLMKLINRKFIEELLPSQQPIDFKKLLLQFKKSEEVSEIQVEDLLDIDAENLENLKKKCQDFTNVASTMAEEKKKKGQNDEAENDHQFMDYLMNKQYTSMQANSINLNIVVGNIERVKSLCYGKDKVKVYFNMQHDEETKEA